MDLSKVTRITVVHSNGLVYEKYRAFSGGVYLRLQDDGRTLKVFPGADPDAPE